MDGTFQIQGNNHTLMLIAKDETNKNEHFLVLSVNLVPRNNDYELSYGFSVHNIDSDKVGKYMYSRNEVSKYLPQDLKGKITPEVFKMSKSLINKIKPNKIYMEQFENIDNSSNSFKRFETFADFIINLGYKLEDGYPKRNNLNKFEWVFINSNNEKQTVTEENLHEMEEYKKLSREQQRELSMNMLFEDKEFFKNWLS